jgi:hypothetical protein
MHGPDAQQFRLALESVRPHLVAAVNEWRASGKGEDNLAIVVDGRDGGKPRVLTMTRAQLELTIPDFDPTIAIELAKHPPGQAPAIVDLPDLVRRIVWIDLTPSLTW